MDCTIDNKSKTNSKNGLSELSSLKAAFQTIPDPRRKSALLKYEVWQMLLALTAAFLTGQLSVLACAEWLAEQDLEFKQQLGFGDGVTPAQSTFHRLLASLSAEEMEHALTLYFEPKVGSGSVVPKRGSQAIAIDGKCQRGRNQYADKFQAVHLISLYAHSSGVVLAQSAVSSEASEVSSAPDLLRQIQWEGRVLTGDAAYCQRELCQQVVEAGGDYLFVVKGNQQQLRDDIRDCFDPRLVDSTVEFDLRRAKSLDKGHGRIEIRRACGSSELKGVSEWPYLAQVLEIKREWLCGGELKQDLRYCVTSLPREMMEVAKLAFYKRGHWRIENCLHWVRDVVLGEDACLVHKGQGPHVLAVIRNTVLNLLRLEGKRDITSQIRRNSARTSRILQFLGLP